MKRENMKCPIHKTEMSFQRDVENEFWPGVISHSEYKCENCEYLWNYDGSVLYSQAPPRQIRIKKMPQVGDKYEDFIEPVVDNDTCKKGEVIIMSKQGVSFDKWAIEKS